MSIHKFDIDSFLKQIKLNAKENQIEWQPSKLEDNVFELFSWSKQIFGFYKAVGVPFKINENTFALKFVNNLEEYREYLKIQNFAEVLKK